MSHPFPSLFSLRKKKSGPVNGAGESETTSGDEGPVNPGKAPPMRGHHRSGSSVGSKDWNMGRCMTCGSLVRWPRELHVFKCAICVTINDLQPRDRVSPQRKDASEELLAADAQTCCNGMHDTHPQDLYAYL
jgi:E3 ubiquitin-protein ligase HECTD2